MVQLVLQENKFVNNKFMFSYGDREALFTIIDEEFAGHNRLGRINRITVLVRELTSTGKEIGAEFCTTVVGFGDDKVGIRSDAPELRGKLLNKDNMAQCVILLYEDGGK
jgi:hypothetical protein